MADQVDLELVQRGVKDLSKTDLRNAILAGRDLSGVDLSGAKLDRIDAKGANLAGANLRGASVVGADFSSANLAGAVLPQVMVAVKFNSANLRSAIVKFRGQQVDFSSANISGADFSGGVFGEDLRFDNVEFDERTRFDDAEMLRSTSRYPVFAEYDYSNGKLSRKAPENVGGGGENSGDVKVGAALGGGTPPTSPGAFQDLGRAIEIRLAGAPGDFALMAAMLSATVRDELTRMQSSRPNGLDELAFFERLVSFLEGLAQALDRLAEAIQAASENRGPDAYSQAREIIADIRVRVEKWASENKETVAGVWQTGLIGVSTAFLSLCGAPATYATLTSMATFGGPQLIKAVKGLIKKGEDKQNEQ